MATLASKIEQTTTLKEATKVFEQYLLPILPSVELANYLADTVTLWMAIAHSDFPGCFHLEWHPSTGNAHFQYVDNDPDKEEDNEESEAQEVMKSLREILFEIDFDEVCPIDNLPWQITVEYPSSGGLLLSTVVGDRYFKHHCFDYSYREARADFILEVTKAKTMRMRNHATHSLRK
jgi:hypothetical protein